MSGSHALVGGVRVKTDQVTSNHDLIAAVHVHPRQYAASP
jgi:hypothetical protein